MAGDLDLRRATAEDAGLFYELRNDPLAVAMSGSQRAVGVVEHGAWFAWALQAAHVRLYVAEHTDDTGFRAPVGTGRLTFGSEGAEISLAVVPHWRGQGIGRWLVGALVGAAQSYGMKPWADVRPENVASLRAFLANGFTHDGTIRLVRR